MGETSETRYKPRACCHTATRAAQRDNSICRAIMRVSTPSQRPDARVAAPRHGAAYSRISFSYFLTGIKADTSGRSRTEAYDNNYLFDTRVTICSLSSGTPFRLPPSLPQPFPHLTPPFSEYILLFLACSARFAIDRIYGTTEIG